MPKSKSNQQLISNPQRKTYPEIRPVARVAKPGMSAVRSPAIDPEASSGSSHMIKDGCYMIRYVPAEPSADELFYEGTARVMRVRPDGQRDPENGQIKAGADLYCRPGNGLDVSKRDPKEWSLRDPAQWREDPDKNGESIPIFPRAHYRYYLEITKIQEDLPAKGNVSISLSIYEFKQDMQWPNPGNRWVCVQLVSACDPTKYKDYFEGNVLDQDSGEIVGTLTMCRVSECLRRATVAIHYVNGVNSLPGASVTEEDQEAQDAWTKAFEETGWGLKVETSPKADLLDPVDPKGTWTIGELQQALYAIRIQRMVKSKDIIDKAEKAAGRASKPPCASKPLQQMTQLEIQEFIPGLSMLQDPLDTEWLYQLLCVQKIDGFDRGVMFDPYGSDSENLPREGAAVAAEWVFGDDAAELLKDASSDAEKAQADEIISRWEPKDGDQLQTVARAYFRVGVHEIGHAMGLDHNFKTHGFMNTTDTIADDGLEAEKAALAANLQSSQLELLQNASIAQPSQCATTMNPAPTQLPNANKVVTAAAKLRVFPGNFEEVQPFQALIDLHFQADDLNQLRFGPDITVRPGTTFDNSGPLFGDDAPATAEGLALEASSLLDAVPFGAPVRINLRIRNTSNQPQIVPGSLSLKTGVIDGSVVDPGGNERTFWPLKKWEDSDPGQVLAPDETRTYSMTLLRGAQKGLFPMAGDHRVRVTATWQRGGDSMCLKSEAIVRVTAAVDDYHRAAALKVLSTPDTLFSLAIVGDHLTEGNRAIEAAWDNSILKPHFAVVRAKLLLIGPRNPDPYGACDLIDDTIVMSFDEIVSVCELLTTAYTSEEGQKLDRDKLHRAVLCLKRRIRMLRADGLIEEARTRKVSRLLDDLLKPQGQVMTQAALPQTPKARGSSRGRYRPPTQPTPPKAPDGTIGVKFPDDPDKNKT